MSVAVAPAGGGDLSPARQDETGDGKARLVPATPVQPADLASAQPPSTSIPMGSGWPLNTWLSAVGWFWLAGAVVCYSTSAVRIGRFQRLLRCARPAPAALEEEARRLAVHMGLVRCPPIWLLPGPVPPMVWWGFGRKGLFLPSRLLERLDADGRAAILAHELAHVCRHDPWVRWLELVVVGLYWWYPLVWWVRRQVQVQEEACCDAWAVGELPPRTYASAILETLDFLAETRPAVPLVASGLGRMHALKWRLTLIMQRRTPKRVSFAGWLVFAGIALLLLLGPGRAQPDAGKPDAGPADSAVAPDPAVPAPAVPAPAVARVLEALSFDPRPVELRGDEPHNVHALALSPDGKLLAAAGEDGVIRVLNADTGHVLRVLAGHADMVACVAFSPDGTTLATGGFDKTVILWDVATGTERRTLAGHAGWVFGVAFAPDGRTLATGSYDRTVRLWDAASGKELIVLRGHTAGVRALAFAPDGKTLASAGVDKTIRLWDLATSASRAQLKGHTAAIRVVTFAPDGRMLASGGEDKVVHLWDAATGKRVSVLRGHAESVSALAFSPHTTTLTSGALDGTLKVWDPLAAVERTTLRGHGDAVTGLGYSPDGRRLLTGSLDRSIKMWVGILPTTPNGEPGGLQEAQRRPPQRDAQRPSGAQPRVMGKTPDARPVMMVERMPDAYGMAVVRLVDQPAEELADPDGPPRVVGVMWLPDAQGQMRLTLIMDR
jgi:beta-lactamase regulating signal transducer with metallopeptidase domain